MKIILTKRATRSSIECLVSVPLYLACCYQRINLYTKVFKDVFQICEEHYLLSLHFFSVSHVL